MVAQCLQKSKLHPKFPENFLFLSFLYAALGLSYALWDLSSLTKD